MPELHPQTSPCTSLTATSALSKASASVSFLSRLCSETPLRWTAASPTYPGSLANVCSPPRNSPRRLPQLTTSPYSLPLLSTTCGHRPQRGTRSAWHPPPTSSLALLQPTLSFIKNSPSKKETQIWVSISCLKASHALDWLRAQNC